MIQEDYCSYGVSKLLKEKGFPFDKLESGYQELLDIANGDVYTTVTQALAMKWLREEHNIDLLIGKSASGDLYIPTIHKDGWYIGRPNNAMADTYEAAVEYGLKYILENLKRLKDEKV